MPAGLGILICLSVGCITEAAPNAPERVVVTESIPIEPSASSHEAERFFDELIARYRKLASYEDVTDILMTSSRPGEPPREFRTHLQCTVRNGFARVESSASQLRRSLGLRIDRSTNDDEGEPARASDLWLVPHLNFLVEKDPREKLRGTGAAPLRAVEVAPIVVDEKQMLHLELRSGGDEAESFETNVDVYVDPESLLIERIEHDQRLSSGTCVRTTVDIQPTLAEDTDSDESATSAREDSPVTVPVATPTEEDAPVEPAPPSPDEVEDRTRRLAPTGSPRPSTH